MPSNSPAVLDAATAELDAETLYRILALRSAIFVVEQNCTYQDLDGRDLEPGARQLWIAEGSAVLATLRVLREPDGCAHIGRVATATAARGRGLAGLLMTRALQLISGQPAVMNAQSYLTEWYGRYGFTPNGSEFLEDGIPHVPMHRPAG